MSLSAAERETIVTWNDEDAVAHIYSSQRPVITRLRKNPAAMLLREGKHDGSAWAEFEVPVELVRLPATKVPSRRKLTEKEREAATDRLAEARKVA